MLKRPEDSFLLIIVLLVSSKCDKLLILKSLKCAWGDNFVLSFNNRLGLLGEEFGEDSKAFSFVKSK